MEWVRRLGSSFAVRRPYWLALVAGAGLALTSCTGPGLEPPGGGNRSNTDAPGGAGGVGGVSGTGGVGTTGGSGGTGGTAGLSGAGGAGGQLDGSGVGDGGLLDGGIDAAADDDAGAD